VFMWPVDSFERAVQTVVKWKILYVNMNSLVEWSRHWK
jgi:hypothetical protein